MAIIYGTTPDAAVLAAFEAGSVKVVRWCDIYEADNVTLYCERCALVDGSVSVDNSRDERRNIDITLNDVEGTLGYGPGQFWYDKIIKPYRGIELPEQQIQGYVSLPGTVGNAVVLSRAIPYMQPVIDLPGTAGSYASTPDSPALDILGIEGTHYLSLPGVAGNYASTPNSAVLNVPGDLEVVCRCSMSNWMEAANRSFVTKRAPNQFSWQMSPFGGAMYFYFTLDGVTLIGGASTLGGSGINGVPMWTKITRASATGVVNWYKAADQLTEPTVWTLCGTGTYATGPLFNGTSQIEMGSTLGGGSPFSGNMHRVIIRNGINGPAVFDADFTKPAIGARSFVADTGQTVTINGAAAQIVDGTTFLSLPGIAGNYASAPDSAALDITGDLEIVARIAPVSWTGDQMVVGKKNDSGGGNTYGFILGGAPYLILMSSTDVQFIRFSTVATGFAAGSPHWIKATIDVDNGAGGNDVKFWTAPDSSTEPTVWTQLGATVTTAGIWIHKVNTAQLSLGARNAGVNSLFNGKIYRIIIRNGINGPAVFDADFTQQIQFATSFTESSVNAALVTVNGTGARIERKRDLELVMRLDEPVIDATYRSYFGKVFSGSGGQNYCWDHSRFFWYEGGAAYVVGSPSFPTGPRWQKITLLADNGAGKSLLKFWTAPDQAIEPTVWTQQGVDNVGTKFASLLNGSSILTLGTDLSAAGREITAKVYRAIVRNGINGPVVADFNPYDAIVGQPTFVSSTTGETWTLNGGATKMIVPNDQPLQSVTAAAWAVRVALDTVGIAQGLAGWSGGGGGLTLTTGNLLNVGIAKTVSGTIGGANASTAVPGLAAGMKIWLMGVVTVATAVCQYYYSLTDTNDYEQVVWTQIGANVTGTNAAGAVDLTKTPTPIFGSNDLAVAGFAGKLYAGAEFISTVKTIEFDASDYAVGTPTFITTTGQTSRFLTAGVFPTVARMVAKSTSSGDIWVTGLGEFIPDVIDIPRFPNNLHITGRDFTKKLMLDKFALATSFPVGANVATTIKTIATNAGITKFNFTTLPDTLGVVVTFDKNSPRWDACKQLATSISCDLYFDGRGYLTLQPMVDPLTAPLSYTFRTGNKGNLVDFSRSTNDARLYNDVIVYGDGPDNPLAFAHVDNTTISSPTRIAKLGRRTYAFASQFFTTSAQCLAYAQRLLKVVALEQYDMNLTSIVIPWLEVGTAVEVLVPDAAVGDPTRFLLVSFSIPMMLGPMSGQSKRVTIVG